MKRRKKGQKSPRMLVLRTVESFYPFMSGPANQVYMLSSELEKRGVRSPVLTTNYKAEKSPKHENIRGVEVFRFPIRFRFMKYFYTPGIKRLYDDGRFDIVCAHSYRSYQTEIGYRMARRHGKPFVLHNHGSLRGYRSFVRGWRRLPYAVYDIFHQNVALKADAVIVNTKQEYQEALHFGVSRDKLHIVPFGIESEKYRPLEKSGKGLNLLWVGRITPDRNIQTVLKALKLIDDKNTRLKIVGNEYRRTGGSGDSEIKRLKGIARELGIQDRVKFIPWTDKRANKEFRSADVFVYTSLWENLGQTILEAAAAGLPLVCTNVGVAPDLIEEGKTGHLVGHGDVNGVAKGIRMFASSSKRKNAERILRKKVNEQFDWKRIIEKYLKILMSLG